MESLEKTIVEYYAENEGYKCGYCKNKDTNYSHGMWAHTMTGEVYEGLINRGWRRSGCYLYKPTNSMTCCPTYTINCHALDFTLRRSQKKVLKKFSTYLLNGELPSKPRSTHNMFQDTPGHETPKDKTNQFEIFLQQETASSSSVPAASKISKSKSEKQENKGKVTNVTNDMQMPIDPDGLKIGNQMLTLGHVGRKWTNPGKSKAKRIERKRLKLVEKGIDPLSVLKRKISQRKVLEDFLIVNPLAKKKLIVKNVASRSPEFKLTEDLEHSLYKKYQMKIHNDLEDECTKKQFKKFLVDSPIVADGIIGSYHQQYYIDDKLIAVGVIDILPSCLSSVYFFFDPDYSSLALGTFGALKEIEFVRKQNIEFRQLKYYYMGFYIHSCDKMKYKGKFNPSFLLCPQEFTWALLDDEVRNKLNEQKYSRLDKSEIMPKPPEDILKVMVLNSRTVMPYIVYEVRKKRGDRDEVQTYCDLVGASNASQMLLYRS